MSGRRSLGPEQIEARERARKVTNWLILLFVFMIVLAVLRYTIWPFIGPYILR